MNTLRYDATRVAEGMKKSLAPVQAAARSPEQLALVSSINTALDSVLSACRTGTREEIMAAMKNAVTYFNALKEG